MSDLKAYILFPGAAKNPLYSGWLERLNVPAEIVKDYDTNWLPPDDAGIVITHNHYRWEELSILRSIVEKTSVPLLILVDGILEYRNSFEHPGLADGSMFQPLIGHKLACIGASQIRWIESFGNAGKCELTGLPRLDDLVGAEKREPQTEEPLRLLVATARTPWFNDEQRTVVYRGMNAIKESLDATEQIDGRPINVQWRMSKELHDNLQAPGFIARPGPIRDVLDQVDAVITTPSTLQLEAAALGLPVAVVDFHNSPQMTPMAWRIAHESDVQEVIKELAAPPAAKMLAQEVLLQDALQLQQPAADRMVTLVDEMVKQGREARQENRPLIFPDRILSHPTNGFADAQPAGTTERLFPDNPVFLNAEVQRLQTELSAAIHEMGNYPEKFFQQRTANQKLRGYVNWLRLVIRNRAAKIEELKTTIQNLQALDHDRPVNEN